MNTTMAERLVRLEEQNEQLEGSIKEANGSIKEMRECLDIILKEQARYKGFFGGIVFIVTCLWSFFEALPLIKTFFK